MSYLHYHDTPLLTCISQLTIYESNHPPRLPHPYHRRRTHPHRMRRTDQPFPHADDQRNSRLPHPEITGRHRHHRSPRPMPHRGVQRHLSRSTDRHRSTHPTVSGARSSGDQRISAIIFFISTTKQLSLPRLSPMWR